MSKKMMKRSLALGALMAFVITGSAMAAGSVSNANINTFRETTINADATIADGYSDKGRAYGVAAWVNGSYTLDTSSLLKVINKQTEIATRNYGIVIETGTDLTVKNAVSIDVTNSGDSRAVGIRNNYGGNLLFEKDVTVNATGANEATNSNFTHMNVVGVDTWGGTTTFNGMTDITVVGNTSNYSWNAGVQVADSGEVVFNGDETTIAATNNGYTSQGVKLGNDGNVEFNAKKTTINTYSDYGVNGVTGSGDVVFNGKEATINSVLTDSQGCNAVGIGVTNLEVTSNVEKFTINITGSGTDDSTPTADDGTAAIIAGEKVNISAGEFNISISSANPDDRTLRDDSYGIRAEEGAEVVIDSKTIDINVSDSLKNAYALYSDNSEIDIDVNKANIKGAIVATNNGEVKINVSENFTWDASNTGENNVTELNGTGTFIVATNNDKVTVESGDAELTVRADGALADSIAVMSKAEQEDALETLASNATGATVTQVGTTEGDIAGEITADYANGAVSNVKEAVNTVNKSIGEASVVGMAHIRAHMNDMNKRMGELRMANGEAGIWTRMVRGEEEFAGAKSQYNQFQLGYDEKLSVDKRWTVGAAVTFAEGNGNFANGSTENDSTAFAIYGSKLNNDGTFVDLIARYARFESDITVADAKSDYSTNGMSVSAEFGKRIQQGNGLWIEPQFELTYGSVDSAEYKLGDKTVQVGDMDSLIGRVGFSLGKDIKQGNVYARASYLYDFDGETETTFGNGSVTRTIEEDLGGGWFEVGVGANINLSKATYIYADVEKTFGGEVDTNWQWNLGVRYSF